MANYFWRWQTIAWNAARLLLAAIGAMFVLAPPSYAQKYLSGTYQCKTIEIAGKSSPCNAPSLELNSDGSYEMLSEKGTYQIVSGHWLILSPSKKGEMARLDGGKKIIFDFVSGGKKSRITYQREFERPPGSISI